MGHSIYNPKPQWMMAIGIRLVYRNLFSNVQTKNEGVGKLFQRVPTKIPVVRIFQSAQSIRCNCTSTFLNVHFACQNCYIARGYAAAI